MVSNEAQQIRAAFPGRSFAGVEEIFDGPTPTDDRFVLTDGSRTYTLGEMSSGEQSIFPILFEFVRQQIHRSVVLIDEIDLNLHPPLAQLLLGLLPRLGEGNQFLFTTRPTPARSPRSSAPTPSTGSRRGGRACKPAPLRGRQ
jgi:AAA domain, putative AbiEii toxin, Type IV TA system